MDPAGSEAKCTHLSPLMLFDERGKRGGEYRNDDVITIFIAVSELGRTCAGVFTMGRCEHIGRHTCAWCTGPF